MPRIDAFCKLKLKFKLKLCYNDDMAYVYLVLLIGLLIVMVLQLAWSWNFQPLSAWQQYKLQRDENKLTTQAKLEARRWQLYPALKSLIVFKLLLEAGMVLLILQQLQPFDWSLLLKWLGLLVATWLVAKIPIFEQWSHQLYLKWESKILLVADKMNRLSLKMMTNPSIKPLGLSARQEFEYLIGHDQRIFSQAERQILLAVQSFVEARAGDLMIELADLAEVQAAELLGPLAINELYETGEKLFVVRDQQKVVGLINLEELVNLKTGQTFRADELARRDYLEVSADDNLQFVLERMIEVGTLVALVVKKDYYLGIIKLETILKQLKIINL